MLVSMETGASGGGIKMTTGTESVSSTAEITIDTNLKKVDFLIVDFMVSNGTQKTRDIWDGTYYDTVCTANSNYNPSRDKTTTPQTAQNYALVISSDPTNGIFKVLPPTASSAYYTGTLTWYAFGN